jgi:rare lipoprotein A (peptidoglycan hydrolase)
VLVALFGCVLFGVVFVLLHRDEDHESFRAVIGVRHSAGIEAPRPSRAMLASYYGYSLEGALTSSGEPFDPEGYTTAHRALPLGTRLLVSYRGESVRVTVNDRSPRTAAHELDLSLAAARKIGLTGPGTAPVRVTVV